jgi:DDE family transposase
MRFPPGYYQLEAAIAAHLPHLRPAQRRGLALWVAGTILAKSGCQHAVLAALHVYGEWHALRQRLREWAYDGADKRAPCRAQVAAAGCFAPLLGWVLAWWQGDSLALAVDATQQGDRVVVLAVSVLYRGGAIPVAWHVLPANRPGAWLPPILRLLRRRRPAVPPTMAVLVLADRGLWSPRRWKRIRDLGWHPARRVQPTVRFQPAGQRARVAARALVPGPGHAWAGAGVAFKERPLRRAGTLVVVWDEGQAAPWAVLTDLPADRLGVLWYGLRIWVELGFRALKGAGWQWQRTRRTAPNRVARRWLVLAVATLWVAAVGTRAEDAAWRGVPPARLRTPPPLPARRPRRELSVFLRGWNWALGQVIRGRLWRRLWLAPEPWPDAPPGLRVTLAQPP